MSATETLRQDHIKIKRLEKIIEKCYKDLYSGKDIPLSDIEKIHYVISEFLDSIHYSREEDSYFACVASYDTLKDEIRKFMIEHEFSRRIAKNIAKHLQRWKAGEDAREPVARFLRTYCVYLDDHLKKEEEFFSRAQSDVLSAEEEREMYEQFSSVMAVSTKIETLMGEMEYLERQSWMIS
ncbi:hemerythrin domain-containing protein [Candidatus Nitrosotenuis cloacae]|jgi:hemerythrin-like domain-containing protein|uniref:hemerythrin domain-containing protein n=1 Tax=Candidatus Nitrosotenuis cloacae TaxID=1603555 RepID=UPI00227EF7E8|nr:hemerythrin domain-containing protein [Candidatus Nitrosotenuis cloacae]